MEVLTATSGVVHAISWGVTFGEAAWLWPDGIVAWCPLVLPCATVVVLLPLRLLGAPRWVSNPLACTQEPWLAVVHTARLGGDLIPAALLAMSGSLPVLLGVEWPAAPSSVFATLGAVVVLGVVLTFGASSLRRAGLQNRADCQRVRVAAVVVDPAPSGPEALAPQGERGRGLERALERYAPAVRRAAEEGARVVVLPEIALRVTAESRKRCLAAVSDWAKGGRVVVVAPFFDETERLNGLHIVDGNGRVAASYEKQHPCPIEPKRRTRMPPVSWTMGTPDGVTLSAVICVDLDYVDLVSSVSRHRGIWLSLRMIGRLWRTSMTVPPCGRP